MYVPVQNPDPVTSEFIYAYCGRDCSLLAWGAHMRTRVHVPTVPVTLRLASQNALARRCDALGALARRMIARAVRPTVLSTQYSAHPSRLWHSYARGSNPTGLQQLSPDHDRLVMSWTVVTRETNRHSHAIWYLVSGISTLTSPVLVDTTNSVPVNSQGPWPMVTAQTIRDAIRQNRPRRRCSCTDASRG